jgi:hypothetical protein
MKNKSNFILSKFIKKTLSTVSQTITMLVIITSEGMLNQYNIIISKANAAVSLAQKVIRLVPKNENAVAKANEAMSLAKSAIMQAGKANLSQTSEES